MLSHLGAMPTLRPAPPHPHTMRGRGAVLPGLVCRTWCVNPAHLQAVMPRENAHRVPKAPCRCAMTSRTNRWRSRVAEQCSRSLASSPPHAPLASRLNNVCHTPLPVHKGLPFLMGFCSFISKAKRRFW